MLRGDIWLVDLDPAMPGEASKMRPAVIVSNDGANATGAQLGRGVVTIVPITSNTQRIFRFQVLRIEVTGAELSAAFGPAWPRHTAPLQEVVAFRQVRNKWYFGWGVRRIHTASTPSNSNSHR